MYLVLILAYFSCLDCLFSRFMVVVYCQKIRYIGQHSEMSKYTLQNTTYGAESADPLDMWITWLVPKLSVARTQTNKDLIM